MKINMLKINDNFLFGLAFRFIKKPNKILNFKK